MKFYHAYVAGKHKLDRIDFFLVERRPREELRRLLYHFGLNNLRELIRSGTLSPQEAEELVIIASKLLTWPEVEGLQTYTQRIMGISPNKFFYHEIAPPLTKEALQDETLRLALKKYHQDGFFLALWLNDHYPLTTKIGGFVVQEAQQILAETVDERDKQFTDFIRQAKTLDDLLGDDET